VKRLDRSEIVAGACFAAPLVEDLRRVQMVQYAGASGDYNPLHTDEVYATRVAGYPTVFAHGMLIMGMVGRVLGVMIGEDRLREFGGRFIAQVWPATRSTSRFGVESVTAGGEVGLPCRLPTSARRSSSTAPPWPFWKSNRGGTHEIRHRGPRHARANARSSALPRRDDLSRRLRRARGRRLEIGEIDGVCMSASDLNDGRAISTMTLTGSTGSLGKNEIRVCNDSLAGTDDRRCRARVGGRRAPCRLQLEQAQRCRPRGDLAAADGAGLPSRSRFHPGAIVALRESADSGRPQVLEAIESEPVDVAVAMVLGGTRSRPVRS